MPTITVDGQSVEVDPTTRLARAIELAGVEIGHRCGGYARCTTCRVTFESGEPETMTSGEFKKLSERSLLGEVRLSCQILCTHDMQVTAHMTKQSEDWMDTGPEMEPTVTPDATFYPIETLKTQS